jgi:hypothetical protein
MSTPLIAQLDFPADPAQTYRLVTDESYLRAVAEATGGQDITVEVTRTDDGGSTVTSNRSLAPKVPGYAKALVGDKITLKEKRVYGPASPDGTRAGTVNVCFDGLPVRVEGLLVLAPSAEGSTISLDAKISASVPFIGGKVEKFALDQVQEFLLRETRVAHGRLS